MPNRRLYIFSLVFFVISTVSVWQIHRTSYDWQLQQLQGTTSDQLLITISDIRTALDKYRYLPFLLTQNQDVRDLMIMPASSISRDVSLFLEQTNLVAGSTSLFVLNRSGQALAYSHWRDQQGFFERSHINEPYFKQAETHEQSRLFSQIIDGKAVFYMSAPIYGDGFMTGVAVVRINLAQLEPQLPQDRRFDIRATDTQLLLSRPVALQALNHTQWNATFLSNGTQMDFSTEKPSVARQSVTLDDLGWTISVYNDTTPARQQANLVGIFSASSFILLALILLYFRERGQKQRLRQLSVDALASSEAEKRTIINKAQVGLLTINAQGNVVFINRMAQQQFALSEQLIQGQALKQLLATHNSMNPIRLALSRLNTQGFSPISACEAVGLRADGSEFPILFSIRRLQSHPTPLYLATIIDISARKRLERALQDANESLEHKVEQRSQALANAQAELIQAEKLAALGGMSTAIVHELNQPLTAMKTYNAISKQLLSKPDALAKNLVMIDELIDRMEAITRQLKVFSYKKPQTLESVELKSAIERALRLFTDRFNQTSISIDVSLPDANCYIQGDQARLEQVLTNLIRNAADAVQSQDHNGQISICVIQHSQQVELSISDNGPGLDPLHIQQLFEPFYTTKPMGVGLGLGLAIVKSIVEDLEGTIQATNTPYGGAYFKLLFPCHSP